MEQINFGLIGCGEMGQIHAGALAGIPNARLWGVADIDPAALDRVRNEYGGDVVLFDSGHDLITAMPEDAPRAVIIATTVETHVEYAIAAIQRGCHVLVEKPMAEYVAHARHLVAQAGARGVRLAVNHNGVFMSAFQRAKELIAQGRIGELRFLEAWCKGRGSYDLWEVAGHICDFMRRIGGEVRWMQGDATRNGQTMTFADKMPIPRGPGQRKTGWGIADYLYGYYAFASGVRGELRIGTLEQDSLHTIALEVHGSLGRLRIYQSSGGYLYTKMDQFADPDRQWYPDTPRNDHAVGLEGLIEPTRALINDFIECIGHRGQPKVSGEDGCAALWMTLGIFDSSLQGGTRLYY
ncbi:MAG: hypothetical protein G01um1014106_227 [Parcubacteria group bacterium Gr01-1014_106]|nr:MAG: hypothetical protein G01um1014106_227 [Parcubacteria group bacterium Gr01-1014_106]